MSTRAETCSTAGIVSGVIRERSGQSAPEPSETSHPINPGSRPGIPAPGIPGSFRSVWQGGRYHATAPGPGISLSDSGVGEGGWGKRSIDRKTLSASKDETRCLSHLSSLPRPNQQHQQYMLYGMQFVRYSTQNITDLASTWYTVYHICYLLSTIFWHTV